MYFRVLAKLLGQNFECTYSRLDTETLVEDTRISRIGEYIVEFPYFRFHNIQAYYVNGGY
jgi:hypothetical protein